MIKLVAFDWNGTILSDTQACQIADNAALELLGQKPISLKKFQELFEVPIINFYKNLGIKVDGPNFFAVSENKFHEIYEANAAKARTRAGARDLLKWLQRHKVPAIIISNHIHDRIVEHLVRLKIDKYFDEVIANGKIGVALKSRTKGDKLKAYMKAHKIEPGETILVGDTTEEVEIAQELGAISVALTDGYNSTKRLKAAKPDYLLGDLRQIEGIIKNNHSPQ